MNAPDSSPSVLEAKIQFMYRQLPTSLLVNLGVAATLSLRLIGPYSRHLVLAWLVCVGLVSAVRFLDRLDYARHGGNPGQAARWRRNLALGAGVQGLLWAFAGSMLFPAAPLDQMFLMAIICGMAGGALISLSPIWFVYLLYVTPLLLPVSLRLLAGGLSTQRLLGGLGLFYYLVMMVASASTSRWVEVFLASSQEKELLSRHLKAANAALESHREHLAELVKNRTAKLRLANGRLQQECKARIEEHARAVASQQRYEALFEAMGEGFALVDIDEVFVFVNPAGERIFGVPSGTLGGRSLLDFLEPEAAERIHQETALRIQGASSVYTQRMIRADGQRRWLQIKAFPSVDASGAYEGALAVFQDITERVNAEKALRETEARTRQAQKLESLGILAGGVAHDMNNVLAAILGLASAHLELESPGTPAYRAFETIMKASMRGSRQVKSLLGFARQQPAQEEILDVNEVLREQTRLLELTTLARVNLELDLNPAVRPIRGDGAALSHAFMNLCINAVDAMEALGTQGTLSFRTRNLDQDRVEVTVEDTGSGMSKAVLERAMDPFYTTKGPGKGTGLGLSMVYTTVKAHKGEMDIHSEPGLGTCISMRFPAV